MSKHPVSIEDVAELLCEWRSRERIIGVAYFSNPQITRAWFMVRTRSLKLAGGCVELGGGSGFAHFSLEGATVNPTDGPMLHAAREFFERVRPLIVKESRPVELLLPGGSVVLLWDSSPNS